MARDHWGKHWILDEGHNLVEVDLMTWGNWLEQPFSNRQVARTERHGTLVSTVFLGIDHSFSDEGPPILFETMIFQGYGRGSFTDSYCDRYATWAEAEAGHKRALAIAFPIRHWSPRIAYGAIVAMLVGAPLLAALGPLYGTLAFAFAGILGHGLVEGEKGTAS